VVVGNSVCMNRSKFSGLMLGLREVDVVKFRLCCYDTSLCGWYVAFIFGAIILSIFEGWMYQPAEQHRTNQVDLGEKKTWEFRSLL
jgi:hypothetical protein